MAVFLRLCFAVFLVAALTTAQAAPGRRVSTTVYGTSYYEVPSFGGVDAADIDVRSPYRALPGGRVAHSVHGGMTISAGKIKTPWYARFGWSKSQVQGALRTGLKGIKKGGWGIIIGFGLEAIIKRAGWFEDDGDYYVIDGDFEPGRYHWLVEGQLNSFDPPRKVKEDTSNPQATCAVNGSPYIEPDIVARIRSKFVEDVPKNFVCRICPSCEGLNVKFKDDCGPGKVWEAGKCKFEQEADHRRPVNAGDIDKLDLSDYQPTDKAADWDPLKRNLGTPSWQEYAPFPPHHGEPQTTVHPDGSTTTTQTDYQPYMQPPDGSYTISPTVHTRERTTTTRYKDGKKTDEKTEEKDSGKEDPKGDGKGDPKDDGKGDPKDDGKGDPKDDGKGDPKDDGKGDPKDDGKGDGKTDPKNQQLSDCKLMPTLCKWMGWTQEEPPEEPDLKGIAVTDVQFEQRKTISFGSKSCPAPYTLNLKMGTYTFDFELYCEFARNLRFFVLALAYLFAAKIIIGAVRG